MTSESVTLKDFFEYAGASDSRMDRIDSSRSIPTLKAALSSSARDIRWPAARDEIVKQIEELLDLDVLGLLASGWNTYRELRKYADEKKYPPDETALVSLARHTVRSTHNPHVDVLIDDKPVGRIDLHINIELIVEGAILAIRGGKIMRIHVGSCKAKGSVKLEDFVLLERQSAAIRVPATLDLGDGIAIARGS